MAPEIESTEDSDSVLIASIAGGDKAVAAFEALHARHSRALLAFCASHTGRDRCEDVAQNVWQRIWPKLERGEYDGSNFRALLFTMAKRIIVDQWRRKKHEAADAPDMADFPDRASEFPGYRLVERERMERLESCLGRLAEQHAERETVARLKLRCLDVNDICTETQLDRGRIDKLWFEAKRFLGDCVRRGES